MAFDCRRFLNKKSHFRYHEYNIQKQLPRKIFIKSNLEVQVILSNKDDNIVQKIRDNGYAVTAIEVTGTKSKKYMLYIQIRNNTLEHLKRIVRKLDNKAFIVVNETKYVENGYFALGK